MRERAIKYQRKGNKKYLIIYKGSYIKSQPSSSHFKLPDEEGG